MSKNTSLFTCQNCGFSSPKWLGQCPSCHEWNTMEETLEKPVSKNRFSNQNTKQTSVVPYSSVKAFDQVHKRISTGMLEFDRVLGGGIVFGSVVLIGGEPGIGKSTLLTQLVINRLNYKYNIQREKDDKNGYKLDDSSNLITEEKDEQILNISQEHPIAYVAGEESPEQIALRLERMTMDVMSELKGDLKSENPLYQTEKDSKLIKHDDQSTHLPRKNEAWKDNLLFIQSTDVDDICSIIEQKKPSLVIVDSIQSLSTNDLTGTSGSIGQLKECTQRLTITAKSLHIPTFLVGHVTKEGAIAGPKVLEHIVDAVLELSGERTGSYRLLRAIKNRFGATDEVGVFQIVENGLAEVGNPSELFLHERKKNTPGSALCAVMEGTRPILVEIQALVIASQLAMPRRVTRGVSLSRVQLLAAVLQKHCHLPLGSMDIFVNVAGGLTIDEPGVDLAVAIAIASSISNIATPEGSVYVGEVGLLGEIRGVTLLSRRIQEANRLGFSTIISANEITSIAQATSSFKTKSL